MPPEHIVACNKEVLFGILKKGVEGTGCSEEKIAALVEVLHGAAVTGDLDVSEVVAFVETCGTTIDVSEGVTQEAACILIGVIIGRALGIAKTLAVIQLSADVSHCAEVFAKLRFADAVEFSTSALEVIWRVAESGVSIEEVLDDLVKIAFEAIRGVSGKVSSEQVLSEPESKIITGAIQCENGQFFLYDRDEKAEISGESQEIWSCASGVLGLGVKATVSSNGIVSVRHVTGEEIEFEWGTRQNPRVSQLLKTKAKKTTKRKKQRLKLRGLQLLSRAPQLRL